MNNFKQLISKSVAFRMIKQIEYNNVLWDYQHFKIKFKCKWS